MNYNKEILVCTIHIFDLIIQSFFVYIGSYDIVTVVGSHTKNHIKSEALEEMIRLVKSGK